MGRLTWVLRFKTEILKFEHTVVLSVERAGNAPTPTTEKSNLLRTTWNMDLLSTAYLSSANIVPVKQFFQLSHSDNDQEWRKFCEEMDSIGYVWIEAGISWFKAGMSRWFGLLYTFVCLLDFPGDLRMCEIKLFYVLVVGEKSHQDLLTSRLPSNTRSSQMFWHWVKFHCPNLLDLFIVFFIQVIIYFQGVKLKVCWFENPCFILRLNVWCSVGCIIFRVVRPLGQRLPWIPVETVGTTKSV